MIRSSSASKNLELLGRLPRRTGPSPRVHDHVLSHTDGAPARPVTNNLVWVTLILPFGVCDERCHGCHVRLAVHPRDP